MNSLILDMCECLCTSVFFVYAVHTCVLQGNQNIQRQLSHTQTHTHRGGTWGRTISYSGEARLVFEVRQRPLRCGHWRPRQSYLIRRIGSDKKTLLACCGRRATAADAVTGIQVSFGSYLMDWHKLNPLIIYLFLLSKGNLDANLPEKRWQKKWEEDTF